MSMFTRVMSHKEVDLKEKFAGLKEKFVKELKEGLISNITSLIN